MAQTSDRWRSVRPRAEVAQRSRYLATLAVIGPLHAALVGFFQPPFGWVALLSWWFFLPLVVAAWSVGWILRRRLARSSAWGLIGNTALALVLGSLFFGALFGALAGLSALLEPGPSAWGERAAEAARTLLGGLFMGLYGLLLLFPIAAPATWIACGFLRLAAGGVEPRP